MGTALTVQRRFAPETWTTIKDYSVFDEYGNYMVCPIVFDMDHETVSTICDERAAIDFFRKAKERKHG